MTTAAGRPHRIRLGACLSLTGRFARFGRQAAAALHTWQHMDGTIDLVIEDDKSDPRVVERLLPRVAKSSDVLLGPYATNLTRAASNIAANNGWLLWNHGGSGDDAEPANRGHVVSVLTPASRYSEPFIEHLSGMARLPLVIARGKGSFGRQVAAGAAASATNSGIRVIEVNSVPELPTTFSGSWALFSAGTFEDDTA